MLMLYVACFFYCLYCGRLQFTLLDAALLCRSTKTPPRQNRNSTPSHPHPSPYEWHTPPSETKTQRCWWTLKLTTCSSPASRLFTVSSWCLQEFIIATPAMLFRFGEMSELVLPIYSSLFLIVRACVRVSIVLITWVCLKQQQCNFILISTAATSLPLKWRKKNASVSIVDSVCPFYLHFVKLNATLGRTLVSTV